MFRDFAARELVAPRRGTATLAPNDAAELLDRYPNLSEIELARLVNVYGEHSAVQVDPSSSGKKRGSTLDHLWASHRSRILPPLPHHGLRPLRSGQSAMAR